MAPLFCVHATRLLGPQQQHNPLGPQNRTMGTSPLGHNMDTSPLGHNMGTSPLGPLDRNKYERCEMLLQQDGYEMLLQLLQSTSVAWIEGVDRYVRCGTSRQPGQLHGVHRVAKLRQRVAARGMTRTGRGGAG